MRTSCSATNDARELVGDVAGRGGVERELVRDLPQPTSIRDLHVWRVGRGKYACILSLLVEEQVEPEQFKERLSVHDELVHVTVEVNRT